MGNSATGLQSASGRTVLLVELLDVCRAHLVPLANLRRTILGHNRSFAVAGKCLVGIVHHTSVVIGETEGAARLVLQKVVLAAHLNVVPHNLHVFVPVGGGLLMKKSECMNKFVDYRALSHAALANLVAMQV